MSNSQMVPRESGENFRNEGAENQCVRQVVCVDLGIAPGNGRSQVERIAVCQVPRLKCNCDFIDQ